MSGGRIQAAILPYACLGGLFGGCQAACAWLEAKGDLSFGLGGQLWLLALGAAVGAGAAALLALWLPKAAKRLMAGKAMGAGMGLLPRGAYRLFALLALANLLAWLPFFLAYYPAICAYDLPIQLGQWPEGYNDHHPLAHTIWLLSFWLWGRAVGNASLGLALAALLQLLLFALAFAWAGVWLARMGRGPLWLVLWLAWSWLCPYHGFMSITLAKDSLFALACLAYSLSVAFLCREDRGGWRPRAWDWAHLCSAVAVVIFRNNGIYALLAPALAGVGGWAWIRLRKGKGGGALPRLTLTLCLAIALALAAKSGLYALLRAQQGDRREMLSVPIQQMARVMIKHREELPAVPRALAEDFLLNHGYLYYRPAISDPVKSHTNTYVARYRTADFLRAYVSMGRLYPWEYVNAFLALNSGYLYVGDSSHAFINQGEEQEGLGYVQTRFPKEAMAAYGVESHSLWPGLRVFLDRWSSDNGHLDLPVLRYALAPGIWWWLYLLLWLLRLDKRLWGGGYKRDLGKFLPLMAMGGYFATLFFGPAVQLRYIYPVMLCLPLLWALPVEEGEYVG